MEQSAHGEKTEETPQEKLDKVLAMDRRNRRSRLRIRHGVKTSPHARTRSGLATGKPAHVERWQLEGQIKSALQRLSTSTLADQVEDAAVAGGMALLYLGGFKSVWSVSQASVEKLLAVKGIGPKRLEAVEGYLRERSVDLKWTAA